MIEIDGTRGGGQLLRTGVSLAAITGKAVRAADIRAYRETPGLRPQHVAAVRTVGRLCDADIAGAAVGSRTLTFRPTSLRAQDIDVDISTAGSIPLLFDAVLPVSVALEASCRVTASGGTDVKWSPTVGYLNRVKLPLLRRFGLVADVTVARSGFYPAGEGEATLELGPSELEPIRITELGQREIVELFSKASIHLEERAVADRQAAAARERVREEGIDVTVRTVESVLADSPGSSILVRVEYDGPVAGFGALGARGKPAEAVGTEAAAAFLAFRGGPGAVDRHMADQLMIFLALAGGRVRIPTVTDHVEANREVIEAFGIDLTIQEQGDGSAILDA